MKNMSHNASYGKLFTCFGKPVYGFNVSVGDVVYLTDLEKYGVVTFVSTMGDRPCFYVTCRLSSGKICEFPFTDLDCKYCVIPASDTVVRFANGVARVGSIVHDCKFESGFDAVVSKLDLVRERCFVVPFSSNGKRASGYWCPVSDLVLKV